MGTAHLVACRLSHEGFGPVVQILRTPVDVVLSMLDYINFKNEYEQAFAELNKNETS